MTKKHILVVDDEPANLLLMLRVLEEQYRVTCVESGKICLQSLNTDPADLILMDVQMPHMDGYECCQRIKQHHHFGNIPVIFLSSRCQIEDKLKGYDAGGADYLTKPCDAQELMAKIEHNLNLVLMFNDKLNEVNSLASMAKAKGGELAVIFQFLEGSIKCHNQEALADLILNTLRAYNFNACVQLRGNQSTLNFTLAGHCAPLESSIMEETIGDTGVLEMGRRLLYTSNSISLLIKNLPKEDGGLCDKLKDHIVSILNGASAQMENLKTSHENEINLINNIKKALNKIEQTVTGIEEENHKKHKDMAVIFDKLNMNVHNSFIGLGLSDEQECSVLEILNESINEASRLSDGCDSSGDIKCQFNEINDVLSNISNRQLH